jgi:hypothetical protein
VFSFCSLYSSLSVLARKPSAAEHAAAPTGVWTGGHRCSTEQLQPRSLVVFLQIVDRTVSSPVTQLLLSSVSAVVSRSASAPSVVRARSDSSSSVLTQVPSGARQKDPRYSSARRGVHPRHRRCPLLGRALKPCSFSSRGQSAQLVADSPRIAREYSPEAFLLVVFRCYVRRTVRLKIPDSPAVAFWQLQKLCSFYFV